MNFLRYLSSMASGGHSRLFNNKSGCNSFEKSSVYRDITKNIIRTQPATHPDAFNRKERVVSFVSCTCWSCGTVHIGFVMHVILVKHFGFVLHVVLVLTAAAMMLKQLKKARKHRWWLIIIRTIPDAVVQVETKSPFHALSFLMVQVGLAVQVSSRIDDVDVDTLKGKNSHCVMDTWIQSWSWSRC